MYISTVILYVFFYAYVRVCVSVYGFFSGFFRGYWPHGAKGVKLWRMREYQIKGETSLRTFTASMDLKFLGMCLCVWTTLLNLLTVFDLMLVKSFIAERKHISVVVVVLAFFYQMLIFMCVRVCWLCGYNSFWLHSYV